MTRQYNRKPAEPKQEQEAPVEAATTDRKAENAFELYGNVPEPKMVTVKLLRNYRPLTDDGYEVVGYYRPAVLKKNSAGVMETVEEEQFIDGELQPPPMGGEATGLKLWAGSIVKLPADEAKSIKKAGIAEYELPD